MADIIQIDLPKIDLDDMAAHECYFCDGIMEPCYVSGIYHYKGNDYQVDGMAVWKCQKCNEECYTGAEADRVVNAIYERSKGDLK